MKVPEDDDDVCTICKNMVKEARDTLESNQTQVRKFGKLTQHSHQFLLFVKSLEQFLSVLLRPDEIGQTHMIFTVRMKLAKPLHKFSEN